MMGSLEQKTEVTLEFAMVSGENNIGTSIPAALAQSFHHPRYGLIDQFVLDVNARIDFAQLTLCEIARDKIGRLLQSS